MKINNSMYEIKTEHVFKNFSSNKEMFDFSNYSMKSKYYGNSNKLVTRKMKDETGGDVDVEFFSLKSKMYSFLVGDNSDYKKLEGVNRNAIVALIHNEYKDVLLNNKCLRLYMNRIQNKYHRIGSYEIQKILLSSFDDKNIYPRKWI